MSRPEHSSGPRFARGRRRPLLRRLLYREAPFVVLSSAELRALFEAFRYVVQRYGSALYWLREIGEDEVLVLGFHHPSMRAYTGLEVVHLSADLIGYYRLPGARVGGRGRVTPGPYELVVQARRRPPRRLQLHKCRHGQLHLDGVYEDPGPAGVPTPERHDLDRSKFADEMRTVIERALEWDYQRALLGEPRRLEAGEWTELRSKVAGLSPRIDAFVDHIEALEAKEGSAT